MQHLGSVPSQEVRSEPPEVALARVPPDTVAFQDLLEFTLRNWTTVQDYPGIDFIAAPLPIFASPSARLGISGGSAFGWNFRIGASYPAAWLTRKTRILVVLQPFWPALLVGNESAPKAGYNPSASPDPDSVEPDLIIEVALITTNAPRRVSHSSSSTAAGRVQS
ncbi:hypothetical protein PDE_05359 [Penicillium oxalicum 114-2]|uniref:Uncharacterized protein n=1 Tax=Penicillium oxalicum (strain 114-2 / CGMCC 5302) TaxID=933388 RepID=S8AVZ3_PENO1|nr:hypothetical protein PDE_05359 [Penicillium oxalicum 114-2]